MRNLQALILAPTDGLNDQVRDEIVSTLRELKIEPVAIQEVVEAGAVWANAVTEAIQEADLIVADVSRQNPNILYELGFAHALRKPILLLLSTDTEGELPFDLAGYQMLTYDPSNLTALRHQMLRFLDYQTSRLGMQA